MFAETPHAAPYSRLDSTERKSRLAGNFALGETVKEGHLDKPPLIKRELKKQSSDKASPLRCRTTVLWTRHRTVKVIQILAFAVMVEACLGKAQLIQSPASGDGDNPTPGVSARGIECLCLSPNLQVYLLCRVFGGGLLLEDSQGEPIHEWACMAVKLGHRSLIVVRDLS